MCCLQEVHFTFQDRHVFRIKGWEKMFHASKNESRAEIDIRTSD